MKHQKQLFTVLLMSAACMLQAQRSETLLEKNWKFSKGDFPEAVQTDYNDTKMAQSCGITTDSHLVSL